MTQAARKEFDNWESEADVTAMLCYSTINGQQLILDFNGDSIAVTVPSDYKDSGEFSIECKTYPKLSQKVNNYSKSKKLSATKLFQVIADTIMDLGLLGGDDDDDGFVGIADNADNEYEEPEEPMQPSEKKRKNVG